MKKAIIIMAKVPEAGKVKTRLQPFLSPKESETLSVAFLQDAEGKANEATDNLYIAVSPFDKKNRLMNILQHNPILIEQTGESLGDKMLNAFEFVFEQGIDSVVMFGTDSPNFPQEYIEKAFQVLESENNIVIGKTEDGGFYLIGLRKIDRRIFENVEWSSDETNEQVQQNILKSNMHLQEIPSWYDVDNKEDLEKLRNELHTDKNAQKIASNTFEWLIKWQES